MATITLDYLIVGGGGSSGTYGGGGGGQVVTGTIVLTPGSYGVSVGAGGVRTTSQPGNAQGSWFNTVFAAPGLEQYLDTTPCCYWGGASGSGQPGAAGYGGFPQLGGGGGGAGGPGNAGVIGGYYGGNGGVGIKSAISGVLIGYGGGGGGGLRTTGSPGVGVDGGAPGINMDAVGISAAPGTGGGGGGGNSGGGANPNGNGGSGTVIVRYPTDASIFSTGGNISHVGGYTIHTFWANADTFTWGINAPTLGSLAPVYGLINQIVHETLSGSQFRGGDTTVTVGGGGVTVSNLVVVNGTTLTIDFILASIPGVYTVNVTTSGGVSAGLPFAVFGPFTAMLIAP